MRNEIDFTKLRFVRIFDPIHIPVDLVEQVRDRKFSVEKFYEYQKVVCLSNTPNGIVLNPLNLLFVIVDDKNVVKGFLWAVISPLSQDLVINTFSMHKDYWGKGEAVKLVDQQVKNILKETNLNRVFWITNYPKHSERYGFKRSKGVLMEYNQEKEHGRHVLGQRCETSGSSQPSNPDSTKISKLDVGDDSRASESSFDEFVARF